MTLGVGLLVNGVINMREFWPAPDGSESQGWAEITYRYASGDQVSVMAWTEEPSGTRSGSFDLIAEWKHA